ncbi:beta-galactosidase [Glycomyces sp. TRM65418]|uniref:beta-galactosidase n=1 Tax=Glycomyces sp. TRM65418 TaxID=2867006 RepID=UPI001CE4CFBE|nr:beta-galactosidase [Glycomyces sp. TRM65418]MCC3765427.1 beta-galactosidase [Glycomyces sp. TRM65418]QZD55037.1 beta-galactosidase [Glycomyces sp. TRM65418]
MAQRNTDIVPTVDGLAYGGDYNPEQWGREVWDEDVRLMRKAGVNLVSVNIFAWAGINPAPDVWDFERLDAVMDLLAEGGIKADLATSTASPPPWFSQAHPETLPVNAEGVVLNSGARAEYCPHAPAFQAAVVEMATRLAERYADHPALAMWHVGNEYYRSCLCDLAADAFRAWLQERHGDLDGLNAAWGTTFWSQTYSDWSQVLPPRICAETPNPSLVLDWRRFGSDALLRLFRSEAEAIAKHCPDKPITTNLMVTGNFAHLDYHRWGEHVTGPNRLVATDHYLLPDDEIGWPEQVAFGADASRGLAAGGPWLLMEQSTNSSAWRRGYFAKRPGDQLRHSLSYVARGSEGAMFFQWRASRYGAERYHSAMVPHGGADSRVFREVEQFGAWLRRLTEVKGSTVVSRAAVLLDFQSVWAANTPGQPSADMDTYPELRRWHAALWRRGVTTDLANPEWDLSGYEYVFAPHLYLLDSDANLRAYVEGGGTLVVGPYSGIVDRNDHVHEGLPGALRDLIGVRVEEFVPIPKGDKVALDDGIEGETWSEVAHAIDAEVVASFEDYPHTPAVFRRERGRGEVWYLSTRPVALDPLFERLGVAADFPDAPERLELVRRRHEDGRAYVFAINHGEAPAPVPVAGTDLLTGEPWTPATPLDPGSCAVIREA